MNEYKRFTKKTIGCFQYELKNHKPKVGEFNDYDAFFDYSMAIKQLGELEDKIENGTLIELPCKVGEDCFEITKECSICPHFKEQGYEYDCWCDIDTEELKTMFEVDGDKDCVYKILKIKFDFNHLKHFSKTIFLTKAEAEARLKKLQESEVEK